MLGAPNAMAPGMPGTAVIVLILTLINGENHRVVLYFFATKIGIFPGQFPPTAMEYSYGI